MKCDRKALLLYAVTDRTWLKEKSLYEAVEAALQGGATMLQLREKHMQVDEFLAEALKLKELCEKYGVPLIINDNVEIAAACSADGAHVGQSDLDAGSARETLGDGRLIGVSVQTVEQAILAEKSGADYLGVGAVFSTATKADADDVSLETLRSICRAVAIPVVAIGGITAENMELLSSSGIAGAAVVSAIFAAEDIASAAKSLRELAEKCFG